MFYCWQQLHWDFYSACSTRFLNNYTMCDDNWTCPYYRPYWSKGYQQTQAIFLYFENCYSGDQILWWGELYNYRHAHRAGYSILLLQLVHAHVSVKAAANPLQTGKDTKLDSHVGMNLCVSSPTICMCWYLPESRFAIFVSVHTIAPSTQILDIVFLHEAPTKMQSRLLRILGTLAEARGRGIVTLSGKIWRHYLQNSWSCYFLSLHCFLYQILWTLINKMPFQEGQIPVSPRDGLRLCIPTLPAP